MKRMGWRLAAFALFALLVRAVIPAGYMLAEADSGSGRYLTLELCDAHEGKTQVIDLDTGEIVSLDSDDGGTDNQPQPCVFAGAVMASPPDGACEPITFPVAQEAEFGAVKDLRPGRGIAAPPPPSTGPPSFI